MKACFRPKAKWGKNAGGGPSVRFGFALGSAVFDGAAHRPLQLKGAQFAGFDRRCGPTTLTSDKGR